MSYEASRTMLPAAVVNHVQEGGGSDYEPAGSPDLRSKDFAFFFAHSIVPAGTGEITNSTTTHFYMTGNTPKTGRALPFSAQPYPAGTNPRWVGRFLMEMVGFV